MSKAHLKVQNMQDLYLQRTMVENLFISEFMPGAPGEYGQQDNLPYSS